MAATDVLTLRISKTLSKRLTQLSRATERARARLAADAIERYLDDNTWQIEAIEEGVRAADAGDLHKHDTVKAWVKGWAKAPGKTRG